MLSFRNLLSLLLFGSAALSNSSTQAAQSCESLFLETSSGQASVLISKSVDSGSIILKMMEYRISPSEAKKAEVLESIKVFEDNTIDELKARKIPFEVRTSDVFNPYESDATQVLFHWSEFVIKEGSSNLFSVLAKTMKKRTGTEIIYNPLKLEMINARGAFSSEYNALYISKDSFRDNKTTQTEGHELIHALVWAARLGKTSFIEKAPIQIKLYSDTPIRKEAQYYRNYLSFDEMITHAYNIRFSSSRKHLQEGQLYGYILILADISKNAVAAVQKVEELVATSKAHFKYDSKENVFEVTDEQNSFQLEVAIPKEYLTKAQEYGLNELQKARKLAEFNLNYFKDFPKLSDEKKQELGQSFVQEQRLFIKSL